MNTTGDTRTAKCAGCRRTRHFRTAQAAAAAHPYGRICRAKMRAAALVADVAGFTAAQIEAAREIVTEGALIPLAKRGAFRVLSSAGDSVYTATADGCNCPNWLRRLSPKPCKHNLAVRFALAAIGA